VLIIPSGFKSLSRTHVKVKDSERGDANDNDYHLGMQHPAYLRAWKVQARAPHWHDHPAGSKGREVTLRSKIKGIFL
jgi:hypothetical protein